MKSMEALHLLRDAGFEPVQAETLVSVWEKSAADLPTKADLHVAVKDLENTMIRWMVGLVAPIYALVIGMGISLTVFLININSRLP